MSLLVKGKTQDFLASSKYILNKIVNLLINKVHSFNTRKIDKILILSLKKLKSKGEG